MDYNGFSFLYPKEEIKSTYDYLFEWALKNEEGTSGIVLDIPFQSKGRGQKGNKWFSSVGKSLIPSILLKYPSFSVKNAWSISEKASLSILAFLSSFVEEPEFLKIKWPNDIYYKDYKIGGLLIGHLLEQENINFSILGIGLNINETDFPSELPNPISLSQINNGKIYKIDSLREDFYKNMLNLLNCSFMEREREEIHENYLSNLYGHNSTLLFKDISRQEIFKGIIKGVSFQGLLQLEVINSGIREYNFKEVEYIQKNSLLWRN